jgi:subtilisin-like proprotein convertase family protein
MKKFTLFIFICICTYAYPQTFSTSTSLPAAIPDNNTAVDFPVTVSGLPSVINSNYGIYQACLSISHPWVSDLKISLISPAGDTIILSNHNGGAGANYAATCFIMSAPVTVGTGLPPFQGNYVPDQSLNYFNDSQDPNGIWKLSVIDEFPTSAGTLNGFAITFSMNPPPDPSSTGVCTTTNASGCTCKDTSLTDCDLLPDLINSYVVIRDGWNETLGQVDLPNAVIDIGSGPIEMKPTGSCFCDTVSVPCTVTQCPNGNPPREQVNQRIYHKNANGLMTYTDHPAGYQSFHPAHNHVHAEDFFEFSLRVATANPDPFTWPIVGQGIKYGYCMINMGTCNSLDSICISNGQVITDNMLPNLDMGTVTGCGNQGQGIFVGHYDIYSSGFGQVINVPGICNGNYYIVAKMDPFDHFLEEDETNNWVAVPVTLTQQAGAPLDASFQYSAQGLMVGFFNYTLGVTRTWDFGDGTIVTAPYPIHTYAAPGTYIVTLTVFNGTCATTSQQTIVVGTTDINEASSGLYGLSIYPNPSKNNFNLEYQLVNPSEVTVEVLNIVGEKIKQVADGMQLSGKHVFELNDIAAGTYFVRLTANDKVMMQRLVKL